MCLLDSFCCCFSLRNGMHMLSLGYIGYFAYFVLFEHVNRKVNILQWYIYAGLFCSICGWIGLRWEKKFFLSIMFLYDTCLMVARVGMIYMHYYYPHNSNLVSNADDAQLQLAALFVQSYFLWVQLSYLQGQKPPATVFHPVPQNVIITEVSRTNLPPPLVTAVPVEYQPQLPYSTQPYPVPISINAPAPPSVAPQIPAYPVYNYPHLYPTTTNPIVDNMTMTAQTNAQPFPYDAPPPYSETKTSPSAPSM